MKSRVLCLGIISFIIVGCSSVPKVQLTSEIAKQLTDIKVISESKNENVLAVISSVSMSGFGAATEMSAGDGRGIRRKALEFMESNGIELSSIIVKQFEQELAVSNVPLRVDEASQNTLKITLNIVVIGMKHGLSRDLNCRFNITGELFNSSGEVIWAYNSIPVSPFAPGYSLKPEEMFSSKESFLDFIKAGSLPAVEKLFRNFKQAYR